MKTQKSLLLGGHIPFHTSHEDLCHMDQIRILTVENTLGLKEIPIAEFIEIFLAVFSGHHLCNEKAMETFIKYENYHYLKSRKWYNLKTDVWFLGTEYFMEDDSYFPYLIEGRKEIGFEKRNLKGEDRIVFI